MTLEQYIGQEHLVGDGGPIKRIIDKQQPCSMILYGQPGIGKTSLANIIADSLGIVHFNLNAANMSIKELKEVIQLRKMHQKIIIIMDEIHRLDTIKQNYLLPFLEGDEVFLIGTTTENPLFAVNAALRSRLHLFNLESISMESLVSGLMKINKSKYPDSILKEDYCRQLADISGGDVRNATRMLDFLFTYYELDEINHELIAELFNNNIAYDSGNGEYYDLLSGLQKSIRASDVNAALHYAARCLKVGDEKSLLRRLVVTAYEDISVANPDAYMRTEIAAQSFVRVGMPQGHIIIANIVVDLALSPKTTSAYKAMNAAMADLEDKKIDQIPKHLLYNQPHKDEYTPEIAAHKDNLPRNLQGTEYFISQEAGKYERALEQNNKLHKEKVKRGLRREK